MRSISCCPSLSNRHSSTRVACAEKSAKFTPRPSHVAPSGKGWPSRILTLGICFLLSPGPPALEHLLRPVLAAQPERQRKGEHHAREQDEEGLAHDVAAH